MESTGLGSSAVPII